MAESKRRRLEDADQTEEDIQVLVNSLKSRHSDVAWAGKKSREALAERRQAGRWDLWNENRSRRQRICGGGNQPFAH